MALQKDFEVRDTGVICTYLKLMQVNLDRDNLNITLQVYLNKAARDSGKGSVDEITVVVSSDIPMPSASSFKEAIYKLIKQAPELSDAIDV